MQSAEADYAEQVAQLQQQVQDFEQQQAVLQAQLAVQPKAEELQRQDLTWLHLRVFVTVTVFFGLCICTHKFRLFSWGFSQAILAAVLLLFAQLVRKKYA